MKPDDWDADMIAFVPHDNTLVSIQIVHPFDFELGRGDPALVYAVDHWFVGLHLTNQRPLCMTCDHEWSARTMVTDIPAAFVVIINEERKAIVSGLCKACDDHKEREARVMAVVRQAFGEVEYCATGTETKQ